MSNLKINTINGTIDNIYINFIKKAKTNKEIEYVKKFYILKNPFVSLNDKCFYLGYINKLNRKKLLANIFLNKIKKKKEKRQKILSRFVNIVKYNILSKKNPCNETDLYTLDEYNKNNKNIDVFDVKNTKWWFTIETICKLICSNLSYFDTETYSVMCKEPINPFINKPFNIGQLINIYSQLENVRCIPNLFMLFRIANFNINYFLKIFNNEIINYSYKFNLYKLDNETILLFLENLFNDNNVYYTNIYKLNLENETVKIDVVELIKKCMITYKNINEKLIIRKFISKYKFIMKRARRNNSTIIVLDDETEINFSDEETLENLLEEDDIELDNFIVSDSETSSSQESRITDFIYEPPEGVSCIQAYINGYLEKKRVNKLKSDMIMKIKSCLVGYLERKKIREMKSEEDKLINYLEKMKIG